MVIYIEYPYHFIFALAHNSPTARDESAGLNGCGEMKTLPRTKDIANGNTIGLQKRKRFQ
jgi:hypothetical protein